MGRDNSAPAPGPEACTPTAEWQLPPSPCTRLGPRGQSYRPFPRAWPGSRAPPCPASPSWVPDAFPSELRPFPRPAARGADPHLGPRAFPLLERGAQWPVLSPSVRCGPASPPGGHPGNLRPARILWGQEERVRRGASQSPASETERDVRPSEADLLRSQKHSLANGVGKLRQTVEQVCAAI